MAFAAATHGDALRLQVSGIDVQHLVPVGTIPGVAVLAVAGRNGPGLARIRCGANGRSLQWCAPGTTAFGKPQAVTTDGQYVVEGDDPSTWARIQVAMSFLPPSGAESVVYLADVYGNGVSGDDVTSSEASAGAVETYTIGVKNAGPMMMFDVRAWIAVGVTGIELSTDGANWYAPDYESHVDVRSWSSIASGASQTLHVRRTIAAASSSDPDVLTALEFAWDGF